MRHLRRTLRALAASTWRLAARVVRWATSPRDRRTRALAVALGTWVALWAAMSVLDFVRTGAPTWWVVVVPTLGAAVVAASAWAATSHRRAHRLGDVVAARQVRATFASDQPAAIAGLPEAVARHHVASSCAPRRQRRAQRGEVHQLVGEVNGFVRAAHAVGLVRVELADGSVHAVAGHEANYDDLVAVAAHRVRRIDELTVAATAASLDQRHAVAGHLDQVAVAARLSAQRQVDATEQPEQPEQPAISTEP